MTIKRRRKPKKLHIRGDKPEMGRVPIAPPTTWYKDKSRYNRQKEKIIPND